MELRDFPRFVQSSEAAYHFGLTPSQFMDRVRRYNYRNPEEPIRRGYGLVCLEDLTLLFPEAAPEDHSQREAEERFPLSRDLALEALRQNISRGKRAQSQGPPGDAVT